jgi:hypothetical protein
MSWKNHIMSATQRQPTDVGVILGARVWGVVPERGKENTHRWEWCENPPATHTLTHSHTLRETRERGTIKKYKI